MKRKLRRVLEIALPVVGMGIIFLSVLFGASINLQIQVLYVLFGVLILEAGVWGLANKLLPNERRYLGLRDEGDHFIGLIRKLNAAAIEKNQGTGDDGRYRDVLQQMHTSVDRMGELAGQDAGAGNAKASGTGVSALPAGHELDTARPTA